MDARPLSNAVDYQRMNTNYVGYGFESCRAGPQFPTTAARRASDAQPYDVAIKKDRASEPADDQ